MIMDNKRTHLFITTFLIFAVISVSAVTVVCPDYIDNGDYEFSNPNSGDVEVTISNIPSTITT